MEAWLGFLGTVIVALIGVGFGIYQLRRSTAAARELEQEKLISARHESELARERETNREYRQQQVLPFLEQLDKAVTQSYAAVQIPHYYINLAGYVPLLRWHVDQSLAKWFNALEEMSNRRIRMLLSTDPSRANAIVSLMSEFVDLTNQIIENRHLVLYKKKDLEELIKLHRTYVSKGYRLMIEIQNAALTTLSESAPLSAQAATALAEGLALPFEKGGVVSVPFGAKINIGWIGIWEININPDWQKFEEDMTHTSFDDFETALKNLAVELNNHEDVVDVQLNRNDVGDERLYCLSAKHIGVEQRDRFINAGLPGYRQKYGALWSSFRAPYEITVG